MPWGKKEKQAMVELPWAFTSPDGMEVSAVKGATDGIFRLSFKGYAVNEHGKRVGWVSFKLPALKDFLSAVGDIEDAVADFEVSADRIKEGERLKALYTADMVKLNGAREFLSDEQYAEKCQTIKAKYPALFPVVKAKEEATADQEEEQIEQE